MNVLNYYFLRCLLNYYESHIRCTMIMINERIVSTSNGMFFNYRYQSSSIYHKMCPYPQIKSNLHNSVIKTFVFLSRVLNVNSKPIKPNPITSISSWDDTIGLKLDGRSTSSIHTWALPPFSIASKSFLSASLRHSL